MASSRKRRPGNREGDRSGRKPRGAQTRPRQALVDRVAGTLKNVIAAGDRLAVALSGGIDSVVLLDVLDRLAARLQVRLSAIHVNHQLSPNAPRWARFCRTLCRERGIPLRVVKVKVPRGNSIEAAARSARREIFARLAADYVVLAHNQDDQVETLLLQLLRGAGVKGLAAMPVLSVRSALPVLLRPLLDVPRKEIKAYARKQALEWVEDESNAETYFLRNFLRHEVLPAMAARFPSYRTTLARSARHFADAAQLLDELAAADAADAIAAGTLAVSALQRLAPERARNLLRYFLWSSHGLAMPAAERLDEALRQLTGGRPDARVAIELDSARLRRYAGRIQVVRKEQKLPEPFSRRWRGEPEIALPELGGVLVFEPGRGNGISRARLRAAPVTIGIRRGGERLQLDCRRPRRTLKNLLQEARVPPWQRERTPLLFCGAELVWAAGLGVECAYQSAPDEPALRPRWVSRA